MAEAPDIRIYLALDGSTWLTADASITWTEVSDDAVEVPLMSSRGRSSEFDDFRAGTCSFRLNNSDRTYDPSYAAGPYFGALLPGVPVKVTGTPSGGSERQIFRGFVSGFPQDYAIGDSVGVCEITAGDAFTRLASAGLPSSVYAVEVAADEPHGWWRLTETTGEPMADTSGNGYDGAYTDGTAVLSGRHPNQWETVAALELDGEHWGQVVDEQSRVEDDPLAVDCIVKFAKETGTTSQQDIVRQGAGLDTEHFTVGVSSGGVLFGRSSLSGAAAESIVANLDGIDPRDGQAHHVGYRRTSGVHKLYLDGVELGTSSLGAYSQVTFGVSVGGSETLDNSGNRVAVRGSLADVATYEGLTEARLLEHHAAFVAPWADDTSGARVERLLDVVGFPADLRDVATGFTVMSPATLGDTALPLLKRCEAAEQGRLFVSADGKLTLLDRYYSQTVPEGSTSQVTFADDGSGVEYASMGFDYDARLLFNRVRGSRKGGADIEAFDAAATGDQTDTELNGLDISSDAQVRALCEARLARYRDPALRVRPIQVELGGLSTAVQDDLLTLELGQRVTIKRSPMLLPPQIVQEALVEAIEHEVYRGSWIMRVTMSPVDLVEYGLFDEGLFDVALFGP